jgi:type I restriction enzyme S subunit
MTFELKRLGDVAEIVGGGTPSTKQSRFWDGEIPWLTPKDLSSFNGVHVERGSRSITSDGLRASSAKMLPPGSVLYTSRAPIGYVAIARNSIATNQGFKSFVLKEGFVPEYVFYLLKASKAEIESHASGATFAEISAKAIADVLLPFPPFEHQRAIANLLSSLDMKLEINRSISKSLESIAQALFKSWFIDFDPVKAKMAGEKPAGLDNETAHLFPDTYEDSKLGLIPTGWSVKRLGELVIKQKVGRVFSSKESFGNGRVPILDQKDSGKVGFHNESPGYIASPDKPVVVFGNHTCVVRLIPYEFSVIQNVFPLLSDHADVFWLYFALQGKQDYEGYKGHWPDFIVHETTVPPIELTSKFGELVKPLFKFKWSVEKEALTLEKLRDALLPRLISGELQIPEEMLTS